jgi:hypothetical protein
MFLLNPNQSSSRNDFEESFSGQLPKRTVQSASGAKRQTLQAKSHEANKHVWSTREIEDTRGKANAMEKNYSRTQWLGSIGCDSLD